MRKIALLFTLFVTVLVWLLPAAPAQAQLVQTFVSGLGSDGNPCTITQPCQHFQAAVNATAAGGEVDALDPGDYGSFTISHAITIEGQGWSYVAPPASGPGNPTAIIINAGTGDTIKIRGVLLDGFDIPASIGIIFNSGGRLEITDSVVGNFNNNEIIVYATTAMSLLISNTIVRGPGVGISLNANASGATITGVFDKLTLDGAGVFAGAFYAALNLSITNSHVDNVDMTSVPVYLEGSSPNAISTVILKNVTLNQDIYGVLLLGNANVYLSRVTQTAPAGSTSTSGVQFLSPNNAAFSDGTNHFTGPIVGGTLSPWPSQ
jgi:hypothetical protein